MGLKWLKDFLALIEHGSFSKAAKARFVSQPAFSRRIRSLENWLGVSLIDRDKYPATLTTAGEAFAEHAHQLVNQIYTSRNHIRELGITKKQISITSQHALAVTFFPTWTNAFDAIRDGAFIRVEAENLHDAIESFMTSNSDFLLSYASNDVFLRLKTVDVSAIELGIDELIPVSAVNDSGGAIFDISSEKTIKLLSHPPESFFGRLIQRECLPHLSKEFRFINVCENALSDALKAMVLEGHGIAWLPRSLVLQELDKKRLKILRDPMISVKLKIKLYRLNQTRNESSEAFWDNLSHLYQ